ncbi:MAG: hypothetical protein Q9191_004233 [Dirinaria sp. TL-2023a]
MALHIPPTSSDALLTISRQQAYLENQLQTCLDAQSAGLLAGLGPADDNVSTTSVGTSTPTSSSARSPPPPLAPSRSITSRQPSEPLGLRAARRGISRAITDLAALKGQQSSIVESELEERGQDLDVIERFTQKQTGLREAIAHIEAEPSSTRISELRNEERALGVEIKDLETKLFTMRNRHKQLLREIEGLDNSVQAKLSSYRESLALAEKDAKLFLNRPPAYVTGLKGGGQEKGVWALPMERRTLELAREDIMSRRGSLRKSWREAERERVALLEGDGVWTDVVEIVTTVEKGLRQEMRGMGKMREGERDKGMRRILETIEGARQELEGKLTMAEDKNWRLLVCAIGAELEALIEGEGVLKGALDASLPDKDVRNSDAKRDMQDGQREHIVELHGMGESRHSVNGVRLPDVTHHEHDRRSEAEDDEPGPDLLISHHDDELPL